MRTLADGAGEGVILPSPGAAYDARVDVSRRSWRPIQLSGRGSEGWSFRKAGQTIIVRVAERYIVDAAEAASVAAVAGLGVLSTGQRSVQTELETGRLVRLLPDWEMGSSDISAILPAGRAAKPSARAFANFIAEEIREIEACFPWIPAQ